VRCLCAEGPSGESAHEADTWLIPIRSVGVQGDERTYRQPMLIESNESDWNALTLRSVTLTNADRRINRVLLPLALKSGASVENIEVLPATLTRDRIHTLQEADALVSENLKTLDPHGLVWQFPVVLLPIAFNHSGSETIVLRPISSENGMTANVTPLELAPLKTLAQKILEIPSISAVLLDLTNKPPATIEWE
jgi:GMP synthase (glutamine-hydrolysing)